MRAATGRGEAGNLPSGLLLFAVSLHRLNRDILDLPTFGRGGFFWVITDEGVVVGAERGPLLGQQIAELSSRFPRRARDAFLRIVGRMRRGSSGNEVYSHPLGRYLPDFIVNEYSQSLPFAPLSRDVVMPETWQTRLVAFTSLMLGPNRWSIAVVSPKEDVTFLIDKTVGDRWLINVAFVVTMVTMTGLIIVIIGKTHVAKLTAVERTTQQLRDSERQLANAQRIAKVGHWTYDQISKTTSISDSMYSILGLPRGETRLAYQDFSRMLQPDTRTEIRKILFRALKRRTGCNFEHWIVWQDGARRFIHQEIEVQSNTAGRISQIAGIAMQ